MRPTDNVKKSFKKLHVPTSIELDEKVRDEIARVSAGTRKDEPAETKSVFWMIIMKSNVTKLAAAAVILGACIIGFSLWRMTGSGIALADVLTQVEQTPAYAYQVTMTIKGKGPTGLDMNQTTEGTVLIAQDYGMKMTMDVKDPNSGITSRMETYIQFEEKAMILLMPDQKMYNRIEIDDTQIEENRQENYDPRSLLMQILECKYENLGRSIIDGIEVEGFHTTDPNCLNGMTGQGDMKIWVDVKTQLPVRLETDMQMGYMQIFSVDHSFQWDCPVDAAEFKPVIPSDYMILPGGPFKINMPPMDEEGAIAGLKLCADMTGRYPEKLDFMAVASLISKFDEKDDTAMKQLIEEDRKDMDALTQLIEEEQALSPEERFENAEELFKNIEELRKAKGEPNKNTEELMKKIEELRRAGEERIKASEERSRKTEELMEKIEERRRARQEQIEAMQEQIGSIGERVKEMVDKIMPIQGAVMFYMTLAEERKEPVYYGNVVTPQDTDKVLLRWKIDGNQYRIIYGDLRVETVTPTRLAELESELSK